MYIYYTSRKLGGFFLLYIKMVNYHMKKHSASLVINGMPSALQEGEVLTEGLR